MATPVYLQFDVLELPQLNAVKIAGVSKSKAKDLIKDAELKTGANGYRQPYCNY